MAEHILQVCPTARASWYDASRARYRLLEDPARFNRELAELTRSAR